MWSRQYTLLEAVYDRAAEPDQLPWYSADLPRYMLEIAAQRGGARALDVGCGAGTHGVQMARLGWEVTGVDLVPRALHLAQKQAEAAGVRLDLVQADVLQYRPSQPFSVVYDSGCLHSLGRPQLRSYRAQLSRWLEQGGDYILAHWDKRHAFDWRPNGPRRRTLAQLESVLGKAFRLVKCETFELPQQRDGDGVRATHYWFKRVGTSPASNPQRHREIRERGMSPVKLERVK